VEIEIEASAEILRISGAYKEFITAQTLSKFAKFDQVEFKSEVELQGEKIVIALRRT
jgi:hypothetical protein